MPTWFGMDGQQTRRRVVTVLFADLVGSTSLAERVDPEDVAVLQDRYFTAASDAVAAEGGVVEEFIGDAAGMTDSTEQFTVRLRPRRAS